MRGFTEDVRLAARRLRRTPGFTTVAVLILALGIGANTALFGALDQALRGAARYPDPERLVVVDMMLASTAATPPDTFPWSYPKLELARREIRSVAPLAGFGLRPGTLTGAGDAIRVVMETVSVPYFEVLGERPPMGRAFDESEDLPGNGAVAILGHALWTSRFGGAPDVVGKTLTIDGVSFEVVGVMRQGFRGLTGRAELWLPMGAYAALGTPGRLRQPWSHWLRVVGRLDGGATLASAREELAVVGRALTEAFPDPNGGGAHGVTAVPLLSARVNPVARAAVAAVSAGSLLLLLIACANLAGLLLARASARRTDFAVRAALGAGRARLARESLTESLLLAIVGGAAGLALAWLGQEAVARAIRYTLETAGTRSLQYLDPDTLELRAPALLVGCVLALLVGVGAGLLPARAAGARDLTRDLRTGSVGGFARSRLAEDAGRGLLVSAQLALTLLLVAGAGLMASSFAELSRVSVGFTNRDVLVLRFDGGPARTAEEAAAFERDLLARVGALPGVLSAATALCPPLASRCDLTGLRQIDDERPLDFGDMESVVTSEISSDYFRALGVRVLAGRDLGPGLRPEDPAEAVVNEAAARKYFGGSAVGHRIVVTHELTEVGRPAEIVGVVEDVRHGGLEDEVLPAIYLSRAQAPRAYGTLLVSPGGDVAGGGGAFPVGGGAAPSAPGGGDASLRSDAHLSALLEAVRAEARAVDPTLPLTDATTLRDLHAGATARTRVLLTLLMAFSALGLLLSAVGIYGVVSYDVLRRRRETGLRVALGASTPRVLRSVLARPALFAAAGGVAGVAGASFLTPHLGALLFRVEGGDPVVMGASALVLFVVALGAAWRPTRRALELDPAETLRGE
jgi:predicted permease